MQKASVNEHDNSLFRKHKIRLAKQWPFPTPTFDAIFSKDFDQTLFRGLVPKKVKGHILNNNYPIFHLRDPSFQPLFLLILLLIVSYL